MLEFAEAVNAIVQTDGVNGLTRTSLINAIKGLTDFDAGGMIGKRSFEDGKTTACFLMVKFLKGSGLKVQGAIQGDTVRVSGNKKDVLQQAIAAIRTHDFGLELQFENYRD